jgi:hypothetical protein
MKTILRKATKYCGKIWMFCGLNRTPPTGNKGISLHIYGIIITTYTIYCHWPCWDSPTCRPPIEGRGEAGIKFSTHFSQSVQSLSLQQCGDLILLSCASAIVTVCHKLGLKTWHGQGWKIVTGVCNFMKGEARNKDKVSLPVYFKEI